MKSIPQALFGAVIGLVLVLAIPMHASSRKQLSPETKEKLNQLVKQHAKLDQLGAKPRFMRGHGPSSALRQAATAAMAAGGKNSDGIISIPHFDFTATAGGQQFPLMFVGAQPTSNGRSTSVSNVIIPIAITVPLLDADQNFTGNEVTFDGSTKVANTVHSPIYKPANFAVDAKAGKTQWGDAMQGSLSSTRSSQIPTADMCCWTIRSSRQP